jgi:hypothetical protein
VLMFWVSYYFFMDSQLELFCPLNLENYFYKDSFRISWSFKQIKF